MDRCQDVLTNDTLVEHDGILIVITLPRHIGYQQVAAQCELTILCGITLGQDISLLHTLTFLTDRTKVDSHVLVGTTELRDTILLQGRLEADKLLVICTIIQNTDSGCVNVVDDTITLCSNHGT